MPKNKTVKQRPSRVSNHRVPRQQKKPKDDPLPRDFVDEVVVERLIAGVDTGRGATVAEKRIAATEMLNRGNTSTELSRRLRISWTTAARWTAEWTAEQAGER